MTNPLKELKDEITAEVHQHIEDAKLAIKIELLTLNVKLLLDALNGLDTKNRYEVREGTGE